MSETPASSLATIAVHEALIRQLVNGQERMIEQLGNISGSLASGETRFVHIERRQAECNARHDDEVARALRALPGDVQVLRERINTMRMLVFGAVGAALLGLLSTGGIALIWVLRSMGHAP